MNILPAALLEVLSPFGHDYFLAQGHDLKVWDDGPLRCWKLDDGVKSQESKVRTKS